MTVAIVILAAGAGRRFGGAKQLHPVAGRPMLERVLAAVEQSDVRERVVVLGAEAERILHAIDLHGARPVVCAEWRLGQGASLHAGLDRLDADAALIVLGDGPDLDPRAIARLAGRATTTTALAADYGSGRSHPVLIPRGLWADLARTGEAPGRALAVEPVDCHDLTPPGDVDYAE